MQDEQNFKIIYWAGMAGRTRPVELMFEDAQVSYERVEYNPAEVPEDASVYRGFAPPFLEDGSKKSVFWCTSSHFNFKLLTTTCVLLFCN